MSIYKAIVQSMFKHVATENENSPLVLILQNFDKAFKVHELRNFTNTNRKKLPKIKFFKMTFFVEAVAYKSQNIVVTPPYFSSPFFKTLSPTPSINKLDTVVIPTPVLRP